MNVFLEELSKNLLLALFYCVGFTSLIVFVATFASALVWFLVGIKTLNYPGALVVSFFLTVLCYTVRETLL